MGEQPRDGEDAVTVISEGFMVRYVTHNVAGDDPETRPRHGVYDLARGWKVWDMRSTRDNGVPAAPLSSTSFESGFHSLAIDGRDKVVALLFCEATERQCPGGTSRTTLNLSIYIAPLLPDTALPPPLDTHDIHAPIIRHKVDLDWSAATETDDPNMVSIELMPYPTVHIHDGAVMIGIYGYGEYNMPQARVWDWRTGSLILVSSTAACLLTCRRWMMYVTAQTRIAETGTTRMVTVTT